METQEGSEVQEETTRRPSRSLPPTRPHNPTDATSEQVLLSAFGRRNPRKEIRSGGGDYASGYFVFCYSPLGDATS
uniref:Uncharacterized protein n=1 Tax=Steinernema glaseri TaxID=37863 RepID=A0A1I7ZJP3_9BILA